MKRQMKMTTAKKPQKKFLGGAMKKLMPKIKELVREKGDFIKAASPAVDAVTSSGGKGVLGKLTEAAKKSPAVTLSAASPVVAATKGRGLGKAFKSLRKRLGLKKGGAVMKDKMGRAMKKTTADAKGRAMKKGK